MYVAQYEDKHSEIEESKQVQTKQKESQMVMKYQNNKIKVPL